MVRPRALRWKLGCVATGLTMDGMLLFHRSEFGFWRQNAENAIDDVARAERKSAVYQHGAQFVFRDAGLEREERPELRIAILLDNEADLVFSEERFDSRVEWKTAQAHEIAHDAALGQYVERFANGRIATAQSYDAEAGAGAALDDGRWDELRGGLVLLEQTIHHFLVFVR